jgi:hypothetical protein
MRIGRTAVTVGLGITILGVGGVGVATASGANPVLLGHKNKTSGTTSISSHKVPLALTGPKSKPPLSVSSTKEVAHLNAQYLDGETASKIAASTGQVDELGEFTTGGGFLRCPKKMNPVGGGVLPNTTGADDTVTVDASFPHISASNVLDGWEGSASDTDSTYTKHGFVFVTCVPGTIRLSGNAAALVRARQAAVAKSTRILSVR